MKQRLMLALLIFLAPTLFYLGRWTSSPVGVDAVSAVTPGHVSVVGALRSDEEALNAPTPVGQPLSADQVDDLVRKAAYYSGGVHKALDPDAEWIIVKASVVSGADAVAAHALVVRGVLRLIHQAAPQAEISVLTGLEGNAALDARLLEIVDEPMFAEAAVAALDLSQEESEEMEVPDGGESAQTYAVPIAMLECDAVINVALAVAGTASGLTNLVGLAKPPSEPADRDAMLVDLALLSEVAFTVLDFTLVEGPEGHRRLNTVVAGPDPVAVDRIAASLPEAGTGGLRALMVASSRGLGQVDLGNIKVNGIPVDGTWAEPDKEEEGQG